MLGAALLRVVPGRRAVSPLAATGVAHLRAGGRAAVTTALVELHADGVVAAGRPGTVLRTGTLAGGTGVERAVYVALHRPSSVRDLLLRPEIRRGLGQLRASLSAAGLVLSGVARAVTGVAWVLAVVLGLASAAGHGWSPVRVAVAGGYAVVGAVLCWARPRTLRGQLVLGRLRRGNPLPPADLAVPDGAALPVALYGRRALKRLVPGFAEAGGLLDSGRHHAESGDGSLDVYSTDYRADSGGLY